MKWKTKDGMELEGTIEEYAAFVKLDIFRSISDVPQTTTSTAKVEKTEKQESNPTIILTPVHRKQKNVRLWANWSKDEESFLKDNFESSNSYKVLLRKLNSAFPVKRTMGAMKFRLGMLGLRTRATSKKGKVSNQNYDHVALVAKKRMQFVQDRAKWYIKTYGWSYEKARAQGFVDFNNHAGLQKHKQTEFVVERKPEEPKKPFSLPMWFPLSMDEETQTLWDNMLRNVVWSKGNICYPDVQFLRLRNGYEWSYSLFDDFLTWFVVHTDDVAKYLKVSNKFKVKNNVIVYED